MRVIRNLARDLAVQSRGVDALDALDSAAAIAQREAGGIAAASEGRNDAEAGDDDPTGMLNV